MDRDTIFAKMGDHKEQGEETDERRKRNREMNRYRAGTQRTGRVVLGIGVNERMQEQKEDQQDRDWPAMPEDSGESPSRSKFHYIPSRRKELHDLPVPRSKIL